LNEGRTIFPQAPIIALYLAPGMEIPESNRVIIRHSTAVDPSRTLESALKLLPKTKQVYVVSGVHINDKRLENLVRREFKKWEGRLEFFYLSDLPMEKILATVSSLPANSIVLLPSLQTDVLGTVFTTREAIRRVSQASNAPVFGLVDVGLGYGLVGGYLISYELMGRRAGELGLEILRSGVQNAAAYPKNIEVRPIPMYDGRQLKRWGLNASTLPEGSTVINKELTLWDFKYYIIGAVAFCLAETALIIFLVVQRRWKKMAEEGLRQKKEELDQFFSINLDLLCIANTDGYFLRLNPAWEGILGYSREELMAKRFIEFIHPDDLERTRDALSTLASQQKVFSFENRYGCKDGTYRWLQWTSVSAGKLIYAAARDITERKQAEEDLKKSEERFRTLIETMNEGLGVRNENGIWTYVNDQFCWMLGHLPGDIIGHPVKEFLDEVNQKVFGEEIEKQRKGNYSPYEITWTRTDGRKVTTIVSPKPIFNPEGQLKEVFGVFTDITERKRTEEELKRHQEHLEELVRERTGDLTAARDVAESANRAKSEFLSNMSHELRTPLNSILGVAQLMERDARFPHAYRDALNILSHSGTHLLELINDVLELSKVEAGKMASNITSFDLPSFLGDLEEMIRLRADEKGLNLLFEYKSHVPRYIETDVRKLRQILINLLGNAIKYTEKGGVTLRVAFKEGMDTVLWVTPSFPGRLEFEVEDTGIGIALEDKERIFEPFVQVNPGRTVRDGTGLGLTLSRAFVELLGGEIIIRSQVGTGSIFVFHLPVKLAEGATVRAEEGDRRVIHLMPGHPPYRLLVVDDSVENRFVLRRLLEQVGFDVLEAVSGQEAIDLYKSNQPSLIWMDLRMAGMDGNEAARRIREAESGRQNQEGKQIHTPIIALTAGVMGDERLSSHSEVFDSWVYKPFRETEIFDMLEKHLGVQFVYQPSMVSPIEADKIQGKAALTPADLSILSADWLNEFYRALRKGHSTQLLNLIDQIRPEHGELGGTLAGLVRIHRFDKLIAVTEGALKENANG